MCKQAQSGRLLWCHAQASDLIACPPRTWRSQRKLCCCQGSQAEGRDVEILHAIGNLSFSACPEIWVHCISALP